ncbi:MAG TPA: hypothetical protein VMP01_11045 [Pirellulaceae bacterium]|nr:hypothetical protein [Pirellulaceae bacterium]
MTGLSKWLLAIALVCGALPAAAQAQGPYNWGYGWVDGYGQGDVVTYNDNIPYFAAHPPVYYSLDIVRRPMGPSPFAYPGYFAPMQTEVQIVPAVAAAPQKMAPVMINNSYYVQKANAAVKNASYVQPLDREAASRGTLLIVNPFVKR